MGPTIQLQELLNVCAEAASLGGEEIRKVHNANNGKVTGDLKDPNEPRSVVTEADVKAQARITAFIRAYWPDLAFVCEEEDNKATSDDEKVEPKAKEELTCISLPLAIPEELAELDSSNLCLFIDPVDGTREFVLGHLENVQTLIGIAYKGRAIAGVVGLPFHHQSSAEDSPLGVILAGVASTGIAVQPPTASERLNVLCTPADGDECSRTNPGIRLVASESILSQATLRAVAKVTAPDRIIKLGGCGSKVLEVLTGRADIALQNLCTCLWDACATEALLRAVGGSLTDFFGQPFPYGSPESSNLPNVFGVIATGPTLGMKLSQRGEVLPPLNDSTSTSHSWVIERVLRSGVGLPLLVGQPERVKNSAGHVNYLTRLRRTGFKGGEADIARDLRGNLITATFLTGIINAARPLGGEPLTEFSAPSDSAVRYTQSDAVRLLLHWKKEMPNGVPNSLFYKRVVMRELPAAIAKVTSAPFKLARDLRSYAVESFFLNFCGMNGRLSNGQLGFRLPQVYWLDSHVEGNLDEMVPKDENSESAKKTFPAGDILNSGIVILMEDFGDVKNQGALSQPTQYSTSQSKQVVTALAAFHAYFWQSCAKPAKPTVKVGDSSIWEEGTYWTVRKQPSSVFDALESEWNRIATAFATQIPEMSKKWTSMGSALSKLVKNKDFLSITEPSSNEMFRTVVHGDLKGANIFVPDAAEKDKVPCLIDFQWTGFGVPAVDVAYLMAASVAVTELEGGEKSGENDLLKTYHDALLSKLKLLEPTKEYSFEEFVKQYEVALVELLVIAVGYHWCRIKASPEVFQEREGKLSYNLYTRSIPQAKWLMGKVFDIVNTRFYKIK